MADGEEHRSRRLGSKGFFGLENLEVYHLSVSLAAEIYGLTAQFPPDERFGLTNQARRTATSVTVNIAEGRGRGMDKDLARFLMQARGSLYEVVSALHLAERLGYIKSEQNLTTIDQAQTLSAKLTALSQKLAPY